MSEAAKTKITANFSVVSLGGKSQVIVSESGSSRAKDIANAPNAEGEARYNEGYKAGCHDCEKKMEGEIQALKAQAQAALNDLPNSLNNYFSILEQQIKDEILSLSFVLAETILQGEMSRKEQLEPLIREALSKVSSLSGVSIRLHPLVCEAIQQGSGPNIPSGVRVQADSRLQPGEAFIETSQGIIDATLQGRLEALREACQRLKAES
ncbi:MAG: hypothetical protein A2X49_07115 [Lentisphaerae bacterium GWF2_52_8]|nr:MAG: hypothetical protein A2X49_07115 [Lentisphaerae bacterium GWF2_52_8]